MRIHTHTHTYTHTHTHTHMNAHTHTHTQRHTHTHTLIIVTITYSNFNKIQVLVQFALIKKLLKCATQNVPKSMFSSHVKHFMVLTCAFHDGHQFLETGSRLSAETSKKTKNIKKIKQYIDNVQCAWCQRCFHFSYFSFSFPRDKILWQGVVEFISNIKTSTPLLLPYLFDKIFKQTTCQPFFPGNLCFSTGNFLCTKRHSHDKKKIR